LEKLLLPLPPLAEQHEIVRRLEQLLTLADQIEVRYANAPAHVDRFTQSLLAFRSELVCQGLNGEPTSTLLMRIRSETDGTVKSVRKKAKGVE
jgi:type I restriction enzyme S subunit